MYCPLFRSSIKTSSQRLGHRDSKRSSFSTYSYVLVLSYGPCLSPTTAVEYLRQELERHRALLARRSHAQVNLAKRYGADITLPETEADTSNSILSQSSPAPGATNGKNAPKGKAAGAKAKSAKSKANKKGPDDEAAPNANAKTNAKPAPVPARNLRRRKTQEKEEQQAEAEDDEDEEEDDEGEGEGEEDDAMNQ